MERLSGRAGRPVFLPCGLLRRDATSHHLLLAALAADRNDLSDPAARCSRHPLPR
jgi:hypothetical protein